LSRRHFLAASGAVAVPFIVPSSVFGENAPSNRITIGCIGMGGQGVYANLNNFLSQGDAKVVAVCDAYLSRAQKSAATVDKRYKAKGCKVYQDFRKIIADPAIDAVCISTPDHWHVPMSLMALEAGKDVFCE
jgi:predicted dehydrogenase